MKNKILKKRAWGILLSVVLLIGFAFGTISVIHAEPVEKTIAGFDTSVISNPVAPKDMKSDWKGSYVYFGTYNGNPMKYRVLDNSTSDFGGTTMLLDCNSILYQVGFDKYNGGTNAWNTCQLKSELNSTFLNSNFSEMEQSAIAKSTKAFPGSQDSTIPYSTYAPLAGEKIFVLDAVEVTNTTYGYGQGNQSQSRTKTGTSLYWWLRSPLTNSGGTDSAAVVGQYTGGVITANLVYERSPGVSPALNIDLSKILFLSIVDGTAGRTGASYKMTLSDNKKGIQITDGKSATYAEDGTITVPYTYTDGATADAEKVNRISFMITDKAYTERNARVLSYGALQNIKDADGNSASVIDTTTGTGTFALSNGFVNKTLGKDYHLYILAEHVSDTDATDYACDPVEITGIRPEHNHTWQYSVSDNEVKAYCTNTQYAEECAYQSANAVTVSVTAEDVTYSGEAYQKAKKTDNISSVTGAAVSDIKYYSVSENGAESALAGAPVNAGNYKAKVTVTSGSSAYTAEKAFCIKKAAPGYTSPTGKQPQYSGSAVGLIDAGHTSDGQMQYKVGENGTWSTDLPTATECGNYTIYYRILGDQNHTDIEVQQPLTASITKAPIDPVVTITGWTYGMEKKEPSVTGNKGNGQVVYAYKVKGASDTTYTENVPVNAGEYTVRASVAETTNYQAGSGTADFTITPAAVTVSGITAQNKTYDGSNAATLDDSGVTFAGKLDGDTLTVTAAGSFEDANAGQNKKVVLENFALGGASKDNYVLAEAGNQESATANIEKKDIVAVLTVTEKIYDGNTDAQVEAVVDKKNLISGDSIVISGLKGKFDQADAGSNQNVQIDSSSQSITGTGADNYNVSVPDSAAGTIKKASLTVTAKANTITYGDAPAGNGVEYSGFVNEETESVLGGTLEYSFDYKQFDNVGNRYTITPGGLTSGNYAIYFKAGILTVEPKEISILWDSSRFTYNGNPQIPKATAMGVVGDDLISFTVSGEQTNANADTDVSYTATVAGISGSKRGNYKLPADVTKDFTIYPKKITASMVTAQEKYLYTEDTITPSIQVKDGKNVLKKDEDYALSGNLSASAVGSYQATVEGKGNYTGIVEVPYKITDSAVPSGKIKVGIDEWTDLQSSIHFDQIFYQQQQTVTITGEDGESGVDKVCYFLTSSETAMSEEELEAFSDSKWTELKESTFALHPDNRYVIYAKIMDKSGNVTFVSSNGIVVDSTAPVIAGIKNKKSYCGEVTFTVSDNLNLKSVQIDGSTAEMTGDGNYMISAGNQKETHTIEAEDKAGNKSLYTITINANETHSFSEWKEREPATCEENGVKSRTCTVCGLEETGKVAVLGHDYQAENDEDVHFVWSAQTTEDGVVTGYTAKAYFVCRNDSDHTMDADSCTVERTVTEPATEEKEGTLTYTATAFDHGRAYHATKTVTLAKLEKTEDQDAPAGSGIHTAVNVAQGAPATEVSGWNAEFVKELMTKEEEANYNDRDVRTDIRLYLEIQDITGAVSVEDVNRVNAQINDIVTKIKNTADDMEIKTGAAYLELAMYKHVMTEETYGETVRKSEVTTRMKETDSELTITVDIPDSIRNVQNGFDRTYYILRIYNGAAEILMPSRVGNKLSFSTNVFCNYAIAYVDVKNTFVSPTKVEIVPDVGVLSKKGETLQLKAVVAPINATNKEVIWISSDDSVAVVDQTGKVTAVKNGTVTITAVTVRGNFSDTAKITVKIPVQKPQIKKLTVSTNKSVLTKAGENTKLIVKAEPENAAITKLIWKSGNKNVATVNQSGKVTAVGTGTAKITVTSENGKSASITITVKIPVTGFGKLKARSAKQTSTSVTLSWTKIADADGYIIYGNQCNNNGKKYSYKKLETIKNNKTVTWTQKNLKKGKYYKYVVKAYQVINGKTVITDTSMGIHTVTSGGKYGVAKAVSITKISGTNSIAKVTLVKGKTACVTAKEIPEGNPIRHHHPIRYESSNKKVATVTEMGLMKAQGKGSCKIYVYVQNGVYKTVTVTVK